MQERAAERGLTLVELVSAGAIIAILAALAVPLAHNAVKREKEIELRRALRQMRTALDEFQFHVSTRYPQICQTELDQRESSLSVHRLTIPCKGRR